MSRFDVTLSINSCGRFSTVVNVEALVSFEVGRLAVVLEVGGEL